MKALLTRLGIYKPTLKELQQTKFKYEPIQQKKLSIRLTRHIEKLL